MDLLQQFVQLSRKDLALYEKQYAQNTRLDGQLGTYIGAELTPRSGIRARKRDRRTGSSSR